MKALKEDKSYWYCIWLTLFLGVTFFVAGFGKISMHSTSVEFPLFLNFLPESITLMLYGILPYIEVVIGALLILGIGIRFTAILAALLIAAFMVSNLIMIFQGLGAEPCNCFGVNGSLTVSASLVFDTIMACFVAGIFANYRGEFFNITPLILSSGVKGKLYVRPSL